MLRKRIATLSVIFVLVSCAVPLSAEASPWRLGTGLSVTGSQTFIYRSTTVDGNREMFMDDNYMNSDTFYDETNLTVTGKLYGRLSMDATWAKNRWNPNERTVRLGYQGNKTRLEVGDINASLSGNELLSFKKRLQGAMLTHKMGDATLTALASRTKAATRTIQIRGNNTPGPYYLNASQILDGSEVVKIDERLISRTDETGSPNYSLDPFSGILTFRDGLIVPETSSIVVSFDTRGANATAGTILGARTDIPIGNKGGIGFTWLAQMTGKDEAQGAIIERIPGGNSPGSPYWLRYIPVEGSVIVKVDGILQRPQPVDAGGNPIDQQIDYDYAINYPLHYLLFTRLIPSTSTITVTYIPRREEAVSADRSVMGFDTSWKLSDAVSIAGQFARSSADGGSGGDALNLRADGKFGKLAFSAGLRDIDPMYAAIDSAGFRRNDRGGSIRLDYKMNDSVRLFSNMDRYTRPYGYSTTTIGSAIPMLSGSSMVSGIALTMPKWPEMSLTRTTLKNSGSGDERIGHIDSTLVTDSLGIKWNKGSTIWTSELTRTSYDDIANPEYSSVAATRKLGLQYLPGERLSLSADYATSDIEGSNGSVTTATSSQVTAGYMPFSTLSFTANYRISDSGGKYVLYETGETGYPITGSYYTGDYDGYSGGYFGGGYVGGSFGFGGSYGGKTVSRTLTAQYTPLQMLSIDTGLSYSYTAGDNATNTSTNGRHISLMATPWPWLQFNGHLSFQDMDYIGSYGKMGSKVGFYRMLIGPLSGFTLDLNYQDVVSESQFSFGSDPVWGGIQQANTELNGWTLELSRPIGKGRRAFLQYQTSTAAGTMANSKTVTALGIEFPISRILGLTVDWKFTDYEDERDPTSNYSARSLNAQLGARFW